MSTKCDCMVLLFVFTLFCISVNALYKEDKCSTKNGTAGTCKFITECPSALELLKAGIYPTICGFEGDKSIICCEKNDAKKTNATMTTITVRTPGDISKQKCKEYAQYAYEKINAPVLLLKPQIITTLVCDLPKYKLEVGTTVASRREFPHMALIGYKFKDEVLWKCGGSLISENFVLTAAHCLYTRTEGPAEIVRVGITNKTDLDHMQERTISEHIPYPQYRPPFKYHDIGLLRLSKNVDFNTYVRPACLQTERNIPHNKPVASGWGAVKIGDGASNDLLKVVLEFVDVDKCNKSYGTNRNLRDGIVDDFMICVDITTERVRSTCQGDSGGPLQVYHEESEDIKCMYDIIGVISFGKACGLRLNNPEVHTRVSTYIKWIEDTVWQT